MVLVFLLLMLSKQILVHFSVIPAVCYFREKVIGWDPANIDFVKLRAFRAHVPTCLRASNYYVPMCLKLIRVFVPTYPNFSRAYMSTGLRAYIFRTYVFSCLKLFSACVRSYFKCLRAYNHS